MAKERGVKQAEVRTMPLPVLLSAGEVSIRAQELAQAERKAHELERELEQRSEAWKGEKKAREAAIALRVLIPGEPVAQGRPRFARVGPGVRAFDPPKSRAWKGVAQVHAQEAIAQAGLSAPVFAEGPVAVEICATFTRPASECRKRDPRPAEPRAKRPDAENVAKAVLDALTGLAWTDDAQVAELVVRKITGAQGDAPGVVITVGRVVRVIPVNA